MATDTLPNPSQPTVPAAHGQPDRAAAVFLTPRVLDQRAFDALSRELQDLIKDAGGQEELLRKTTGEVRGLSGVLRTALRELQDRLDRAGKVSPALEQWVRDAQELSAKAIDPRRVARELERAIEGIVEGRRAEFEHAVAPTVETLRHLKRETDRVRQAAEGLLDEQAVRARVDASVGSAVADAVNQAVSRAVHAAAALASARVSALEERTNEACRTLAEQSARADAATARAQHALEALNARAAELERESARRFTQAEDRLAAAERRVRASADDLDHRAGAMLSRTASVLAQAEEARRSTEGVACKLEAGLEAVRSRAAAVRTEDLAPLAESLVGLEARAERLAALPSALAHGERLLDDARRVGRDAAAIKDQVDLARSLLAEELLAATAKIDALSAAADAKITGLAAKVEPAPPKVVPGLAA